jgi:segregation and condensation protein A
MINFKIEKFEGPLDLLLQLIEKEELNITEICLAKIADQYIDYIKDSPAIDPDEMADFLVVAAKLLLIKSRALLPYLLPEEEKEIEEFENQLRMYQEFIAAMKKIQALIGEKRFMFQREFNRQAILMGARIFSPPKKLTAADLTAVYGDIILRLKPVIEELKEEKISHKIRIEDKIMAIQEMLLKRMRFTFSHVLEAAKSKTEIIVSFLALLELTKQRVIVVEQTELFEEIIINKSGEQAV